MSDDEVKRKPLSSLISKTIAGMEDAPRNHVYLMDQYGQIICSVDRDDLFDAEGNRFEDDV